MRQSLATGRKYRALGNGGIYALKHTYKRLFREPFLNETVAVCAESLSFIGCFKHMRDGIGNGSGLLLNHNAYVI